tara:strand:- start:15721 stop:16713 length:993 start_codon:yes stop_codon:yes gene_type:complete
MLEYISEYILFLVETLTIVLSIAGGLIIVIAFAAKSKLEMQDGAIKIKNLNKKYKEQIRKIKEKTLSKTELKDFLKNDKKSKKQIKSKPKLFVIDFNGDIKASDVESLRKKISAIILTADSKKDEVLLNLESPGGMVHGYGLAAAELARLRDKKIKLTIAVDKVAASGGYLMASIANKIIAAPFAIVGSIGVIAQIPNFNKLLKKHNVDFEQHTAGEYKRTLTIFGENTDEGRAKFQEELEGTHVLFKEYLETYREKLDIDKVATGEHWYAKQAIDLNLVDEILTSDDFILNSLDKFDIFSLNFKQKKSFFEKLNGSASSLLMNILHRYN